MEVEVDKKSFEKLLKEINKAVDNYSDNYTGGIEITKEEIKIRVVDGGRVFLIKAKIDCTGTEGGKIWIDGNKALKLLKLVKENDLTLKVEGNKIWLNENVGIGLLDTADMKEPKEQKLILNIKAEKIDLQEFYRIIKIGLNVSDYLKFTAKDGKLLVEIEGEEDIIRFELGEAQGEGMAKYSLEYLERIVKGHNGLGNIEFDIDKPLRMKVDEKDIKVEYLLAPRIEG